MKIDFWNARFSSSREGVEIYPLPAVQVVLNEYGEHYQSKWEIRFWWIWFRMSIKSSELGKPFFKISKF